MRFEHPYFTLQELKNAFFARNGSQRISYRYELLDKSLRRKFDLPNVTKGYIDYSGLADIKRIAKFTLIEDETLDIDYLNDRIKPYMRVYIPPKRKKNGVTTFYTHMQSIEVPNTIGDRDGGWVEFPLGVFFLSSPSRQDEGNNVIIREIDAYDGLIVLLNDKLLERLIIPAGTPYTEAMIGVLTSAGINQYNIQETSEVLPRDMEFEPGREKLYVFNELERQINFTQANVDENGFYVSEKYISPSEKRANLAYKTDNESVIYVGASEELDLFNVPNVFVAIRSNAEQEPITSTYINNNPESPTSYPSRGFYIVDRRELEDIADQAALDSYVRRVAFDASQVYGRIKFRTLPMPFHGFMDVIDFHHDPLGIEGKFVELAWTLDMDPVNGTMEHELRKIVDVGGAPE